MHLDSLIHGLFITETQFRLLFTSTTAFMYTYTGYNIYIWRNPLAFSPLAPSFSPPYLLGTLLAVTGSIHLGLRLLVN